MTKQEFIDQYIRNMIEEDIKDFLKTHMALHCACGEENCNGWAMVTNNTISIKAHLDLYDPKQYDN